MIKKIIKQLVSQESVRYLLFGVLTTIVNFGSYIVFNQVLGKKYYLISNILAFIVATTFAFITNKQFVFKSNLWIWRVLIREVFSFVSSRIGTFLIVEEAGLWFAVQVIGVDNIQLHFLDGTLIAKVMLAFIAVMLNYILSKCLVFRKNRDFNGFDDL